MNDKDTLSLDGPSGMSAFDGQEGRAVRDSRDAVGSPLGAAARPLDLSSSDQAGEDTGRVNPKWTQKAADLGGPSSSGQAARPAAQSSGGTWVWLPQGLGPKPPWRKRHPVLFWGGVLLILAAAFGWGRFSGEESPITGPKIAVINVEGLIMDAGPVVAFMEKVRRDPSFKGAVLRINSPGGGVGPSQEIYEAAKRLGKSKPVVASMGALAASGGYYAALGADEILAGPSTMTASIGVIMQIPNFEGLMRSIGISEKTLATGKLKGAGSSWREMTPEEEAYFRGLLNDMYEEFIATVARERELPLETVKELADGRAMTGRQALEAGLVDRLGDLYAALQNVRERCGLGPVEARLVEGPEKPRGWLREMLNFALETVLREKAAAQQPIFIY